MQYSKLQLNQFTQVDYAFIDTTGAVVGSSINISAFVAGSITEDENVVIDFSKCKNAIKSILDDNTSGVDHKLWIAIEHSNIISLTENFAEKTISITTPKVKIELPATDVVKYLGVDLTDANSINMTLSRHVTQRMNMLGFNVNVEIIADIDPLLVRKSTFNGSITSFNYVHGLKNSSSYGCKNIAHGHLSFITSNDIPTDVISDVLNNEFHNKVLVNAENIRNTSKSMTDDSGELEIAYSVSDRGSFKMNISSFDCLVMPTETTCEHIAVYFAKIVNNYLASGNYEHSFSVGDTFSFYISEGLAKGVHQTWRYTGNQIKLS